MLTCSMRVNANASANPAEAASMVGVRIATRAIALDARLVRIPKRVESQRFALRRVR